MASSGNLYRFSDFESRKQKARMHECNPGLLLAYSLVGQHPKPFEPALPGCGPAALWIVLSGISEDEPKYWFQNSDCRSFQTGLCADLINDLVCAVIDLFLTSQVVL